MNQNAHILKGYRSDKKANGVPIAHRELLTSCGVTDYDRYSIYLSSMYMPKQKLNPLPSAAFHILLALADEDRHGYGIMRQVSEQTAGSMRLGPGTLYSSIQALLEAGLVAEADASANEKVGHERRRYYRLTPAGRKLARSEAERMADFLRVARSKKILRGEYV